MTPGDQLGKYRLERELGAGGMGAVWLAHDTELDRKVALKVLRPALAGDDTAQARLLREARAMAKLRHPNVITVFDAETIAGRDLVAMELVDGANMAAWLASERTEDEIVATVIAAGRGLAAAHAAGMVHRDFKPHNVLVEKGGRVLVTDFGLARADGGSDALAETAVGHTPTARPLALEATVSSSPATPLALDVTASSSPSGLEETAADPTSTPAKNTKTTKTTGGRGSLDSDLTRTGTLLGTPAYMAPEQLRGAPADARADQFAFCVTAWEALAGKRPFPGEDLAAIAAAIERGDPAFADRVPRRFRPLLVRGLSKDPAARWPSMDPLLDAVERAWKRPKRVRDWSMAIGLGVVGFFVILFATAFFGSSKPKPGDSCNASDAIAGVWGAGARASLVQQIGDPKAHVLDLIDRWAHDWSAAYDANCKQRDDDFAARKLCLEAQRDSVAMLVVPRDAADAKALAATDLAVMLPAPEGCVRAPRVIAPPLPKDPVLRSHLQEMRTLLIIMRGKLLSSEPITPALLQRAKDVVAALEKYDDPNAKAGAVSLKSMVIAAEAVNNRDPKAMPQVYALMKQAADLSEAAGEDRTRVQLILGMTEMVSAMPGFWADIDDLLRRGEAGVQHVKDPIAELVLLEVHARVASVRGLWSEAIDDYDKARKGWLARGSEEIYGRFTLGMAIELVNRHAPGDLDRAIAALDEVSKHPVQRHKDLDSTRESILELAARADDAMLNRLGYAKDAAMGTGTLVATIAGLAPPTLKDDPATRVERAGIPEIMVRQGKLSWRVPVAADGTYTLTRLAAGHYLVEAFVNTALGDLQMVHADAEVAAGATARVTVTYPTPHVEKTTIGPATGQGSWGIAVALPGKVSPATVGELRAAIAKAAWWSVATVHGAQQGPSTVFEAELGAFGTPVTICPLEGGYNDGSQPELFVGPDARPIHCE
jgi:serine/threonine protein kinase